MWVLCFKNINLDPHYYSLAFITRLYGSVPSLEQMRFLKSQKKTNRSSLGWNRLQNHLYRVWPPSIHCEIDDIHTLARCWGPPNITSWAWWVISREFTPKNPKLTFNIQEPTGLNINESTNGWRLVYIVEQRAWPLFYPKMDMLSVWSLHQRARISQNANERMWILQTDEFKTIWIKWKMLRLLNPT